MVVAKPTHEGYCLVIDGNRPMASILNVFYFQDEEAAYAKLESIVWPNGAVCLHCGSLDKMKRMGGAATRPGLYKCYACRKQSRVTVGTVFESSHVKLHMWLQAAYLMCSSKKGISSNQLSRVLGVTVKTAWFMSHRFREAIAGGVVPPTGGEGEIDETYIGDKGTKLPNARGYAHKHAILTLVERGMKGIYQHCSEKHLHRYVAEFDFRYNNRVRLGVDDLQRTNTALRGVVGKRLTYEGPASL